MNPGRGSWHSWSLPVWFLGATPGAHGTKAHTYHVLPLCQARRSSAFVAVICISVYFQIDCILFNVYGESMHGASLGVILKPVSQKESKGQIALSANKEQHKNLNSSLLT